MYVLLQLKALYKSDILKKYFDSQTGIHFTIFKDDFAIMALGERLRGEKDKKCNLNGGRVQVITVV